MTVNPGAGPEADEADAAEQTQPLLSDDDVADEPPTLGTTEASEADLLEQAHAVTVDDDEDYLSPDEQ